MNHNLKASDKSTSLKNFTNCHNSMPQNDNSLILQAPQQNDILFFNENGYLETNRVGKKIKSSLKTNWNTSKKQVKFPEDKKIIKDYSEAPKTGWIPGRYSTNDLFESYLKSCDRHKTRPLNRLIPQLKALQEIECLNGEKVNVLNLKNEKLDSKQMESVEEIFKRLSFKTIDLESSQFEDDTTGAILFEILDYYDTCERLILTNVKGFGLFGWQELSKYIKKSASIETIELRYQIFTELIYFTYLARSFRFAQSLRIVHLENSNINSRFLSILSTALRDNEHIKELYLCDNKIQPQDGNSIANIIKENKYLELIDLKNNNLQDTGLATICMSLSERSDINSTKSGLKSLSIANNSITTLGCTYLCKALIHNCTLTNLNISNNSLTNESIFELKEALIVNKKIECLILTKVRMTDEGVIALAEYLAETRVLKRLDLRENDIRLGGLMALASSIKFNRTLDRIDLDREPKKENTIKDSVETSKRLIQDINECCLSNRREKEKNDTLLRENHRIDDEDDYVKLQDSNELCKSPENDENNISTDINAEEDLDIITKDDELLKKILNRTYQTNSPNLHSPVHPNEDIINLFNIENDIENQLDNNKEDFQFIEQNLSLNIADFEKIIYNETPLNSNQKCIDKFSKKRLDFEKTEISDIINEIIEKIEGEQYSQSNLIEDSLFNLTLPNIPQFLTPDTTPIQKEKNNEPLFASQLTTSQLNEELSNEILV